MTELAERPAQGPWTGGGRAVLNSVDEEHNGEINDSY